MKKNRILIAGGVAGAAYYTARIIFLSILSNQNGSFSHGNHRKAEPEELSANYLIKKGVLFCAT